MGTPMAFTSGTTNGFSLGATKRATVAVNPATSLVSGNNWFNGVDVSTQYLIYSDTFSQGQAPITTARPTAWTTPDLTDASLLALINTLPDRVGQVPYTDINVALQWLQNSEKYFLIKNGYEDIVTNGLVLNLDAGWYNSYPGNTSSIASSWTDYNNSQAYYTPISNNGVILYSTTTNWVGYFPATVNSAGLYTLEFDYVTNDAGTLVLDNDGIVDNEWNANIANTTTQQKYKVTRYIGTTGNINFFLRRNSGGNHTITNFSFTNANTWFDLSGQGNNATLLNGPTFSSNGQGSFNFDGTDDFASLGNFFTYQTFTIGLWVKPDGSQTTYADIIDNNHRGDQNWVLQQNVANLNEYEFAVFGSAGQLSGSGLFTLTTDEWVYLTFTFDGTNLRSYRNGIQFSTGAALGTTVYYNDQNFYLGYWGGGGRNWNGEYGIVHSYNRALSNDEVFQNYNAQKARYGFGGQSLFSGVTQYLDFSKQSSYPGSGTLVTDISGNGNDGTFNNGSFTTLNGVKCFNASSTNAWVVSDPVTLGSNYTIFIWANMLANSEVPDWRTLVRSSTTPGEDHELIVRKSDNLLGYYDNENGSGFNSYGINVANAGLEKNWILYTLVGENATLQKVYINDGTLNSSVNRNASGQQIYAIGNYQGGNQQWGYFSNYILYNNQAFTQAQVEQYFEATKQYYGYAPNNILTNGLMFNYDASNPLSYPTTGTTWFDLNGTGDNVNLINGPTFSTSGGGSINFDGTDDYGYDQRQNEDYSSDITVSIWVNVDANPGGYRAFCATKSSTGLDYNSGFNMDMWSAGSSVIDYFNIEGSFKGGGGGFNYLNPGTSFNFGTWVNFIFRTTASELTLWANNVEQQTYSRTNSGGSNIYYRDVYVGTRNYGGGPTITCLDGKVAVFLLYNRSLSDVEISQLWDIYKGRFGY